MTTSISAKSDSVKTASPAEAQESKRLSDDAFRSLCQDILSCQGKKRRMLCRAFKAAFNDLYCSKSLERLNVFLKTIELLPEKGKLIAACRAYLGGIEISKDGDLIRHDELCCAVLAQHVVRVPGKSEPGKKIIAKDERQFILLDDEQLFSAAQALWEMKLSEIDFDCLSVKSPKKEVTVQDVRDFFHRLDKNRARFSKSDAELLETFIVWAKQIKLIA